MNARLTLTICLSNDLANSYELGRSARPLLDRVRRWIDRQGRDSQHPETVLNCIWALLEHAEKKDSGCHVVLHVSGKQAGIDMTSNPTRSWWVVAHTVSFPGMEARDIWRLDPKRTDHAFDNCLYELRQWINGKGKAGPGIPELASDREAAKVALKSAELRLAPVGLMPRPLAQGGRTVAPGGKSTPAGRVRRVRVAILKNSSATYVREIAQSFEKAAAESSPPVTKLVVVTETGRDDDVEANVQTVRTLIGKFGLNPPDYFISVGTAVSEAAAQEVVNTTKLIYLGVSSPEKTTLRTRSIAEPGFVWGVRYGVPVIDTVAILRGYFPGKSLAFLHSGDRYLQDVHLREELEEGDLSEPVEFVSLESPGPVPELLQDHIFFGRYFLCTNIGEFVRANPGVAFIGVSPANVDLDAVMSVGFRPTDIGVRGGRDILAQDLSFPGSLRGFAVVEPESGVIRIGSRALRRCGLSIDGSFKPAGFDVSWTSD